MMLVIKGHNTLGIRLLDGAGNNSLPINPDTKLWWYKINIANGYTVKKDKFFILFRHP
jgi:hypothetical protein